MFKFKNPFKKAKVVMLSPLAKVQLASQQVESSMQLFVDANNALETANNTLDEAQREIIAETENLEMRISKNKSDVDNIDAHIKANNALQEQLKPFLV